MGNIDIDKHVLQEHVKLNIDKKHMYNIDGTNMFLPFKMI